ncbi:MAG: outer membrane lipoprotein-sorting protein, partial [Halobacteriovoraceae bacterium]|nr:outer membrane lipoprotein-sorting protein [Halobacteriovoraceae bacterium]
IAIQPTKGSVFNKQTLLAIQDLTKKAWQIPFSTRVDSITNFQHTEASEDDLVVRDLVPKGAALTSSEIEKIKRISTTEPLLRNTIIAPDGRMTALNIRVTLPGKALDEGPQVAAYVRELASKFEAENPGHKVYLTGLVMLNTAFNEAAIKDMGTLIPLMYLAIIVIMAFLLKSFFAVATTFTVLLLSVAGSMGIAGWLGIPITPPSSIAPTVILTLAIADSVHILKSIITLMKKGWAKKEAIIEGLRVNLQPVFLTSFTTAIGFLSLNFSDTPPFNDLGNITAFGVVFAFLLSITLLPVMTDLFPLKVKKSADGENAKNSMSGFSALIVKNKKPVLLTTVFITVFLGLQVPKIELNDQFINYFDESVAFRVDSDHVSENLTGIYQVNFNLQSGESQGISAPSYLKKVEEFSLFARSIKGVTHVNTVTDIFKRLNKNMHGDDQTYYGLPDRRDLAAQYLLLYEMSLPYGLDLNNQIDVDKSGTRVIVTLDNLETKDFIAINKKLEDWLVANAPISMQVLGTSPAIMFSHITERNVRSMGWGTLLAFLLISLTLVFALRSWKYGLISLLPNIIPAGIAFGVWSLTIGQAGFAIAVVTSVTLGIVVDDTVHFLSKYVRARKEQGLSAEDAVTYSFETVGSALIATSVILASGFGILMFSTFKMNWTLGALSAMTIMVALIIDFTFLPALLLVLDRKKEKNTSSGGNMNFKNITASLVVGFLAMGLSTLVKAESKSSQVRGLEIAKSIDKQDEGWKNQIADVQMILKNKQGQESKRAMKIKTLEVTGDGDKSLTTFKTPRDVKGTSFLSFSHTKGNDDQWLYLPALKRVKRISSNNKSGPFMGSQFAYEDIASQEVGKYTYNFIKDTQVNGLTGHLFERYPIDENSGYTKQIVWVDNKAWRVHKVEFYD